MKSSISKVLRGFWVLVMASAICQIPGVVRAQEEEAQPEAAPPRAEAVVEEQVIVADVPAPVIEVDDEIVPLVAVDDDDAGKEASLAATPAGEDGVAHINISLDSRPIGEAVKLISKVAGVSIIWVATNTTQLVSADVTDRPWKPVLQSLLDPCGLQLTERPVDTEIYVVVPKNPDEREPWITESFELDYLKSSEAAELLKTFLGIAVEEKGAARRPAPRSTPRTRTGAFGETEEPREEVVVAMREDGRVVSYPAGNTVVVSTSALKMEEVRAVIKMIDNPRPQVYIEAKIVEVTGRAGKTTGVDWEMLRNYSLGIGGGMSADGQFLPITRDRTKSKIRERGGASFRANERATGDYAGGRAAPIDTVASGSGPFVDGLLTASGAASVEGWNQSGGAWRGISDVQTAVFSADALRVALSVLEETADSSLVSNPKVIVANEERAIIDMSRKEPYVKVKMETEGTGDNKTYTYSTEMDVIPGRNENLPYIEEAFFTYGIKVDVTPRVNNATNITVTIQPTISELDMYYAPGDGLTRYPIINSKRVRTVFSLGDGKTAVIGGLTTTRDEQIVKKVPLLGDIPLIGSWLFSHRSTQKVQTETIIFVTVGIVDPEDSTDTHLPEGARLAQKYVTPDGKLLTTQTEVDQWQDEMLALEKVEVITPLDDEE